MEKDVFATWLPNPNPALNPNPSPTPTPITRGLKFWQGVEIRHSNGIYQQGLMGPS